MKIKEIMQYIESEYSIINRTPCEICGGDYFADGIDIALIDDEPYDVCKCVCSDCGHEKSFIFSAPFIDPKPRKNKISKLN